MKPLSSIVLGLLFFVCVGTLFGVVIKDRPTAFQRGEEVVVGWRSADETGVVRYEVLRAQVGSTPGEFRGVGSVEQGQLKGNNSTYEYVDRIAWKTSDLVFAYKIRVHFSNGSTEDTQAVSTAVLSSVGKRTWGSIKAMFR